MSKQTRVNGNIREFLLNGEKNKDFVMTDIPKHGLGGGIISELIYYYDINKFYNKHYEEIWDEIDKLGGLIEIIKDEKNQPSTHDHFNCLMTWLAVESIACYICNEREEKVA